MTRRTLPARRLAVAAVLPLALTTLVACGDDSSSGDDAAPSSAEGFADEPEEEPTTEAPAEEAPAEAEGGAAEPAAFMDAVESAFADATTVKMTMEMTNAAGGMTAEGEADYSQTPPELSMTMGGAALQGQEMQVVMVDGTMYLKSAAMGPTWMRLASDDPTNPFGSLTGQLDPRESLSKLGDAITGDVTRTEEEIDGEPVESYTVSVDPAAALGEAAGQLPPGAAVPETIEYTVSIGEDDKLRRMQVMMGETLGDMTMDFTDWGGDVSIEAPPADQVKDFDMGAMMGGGAPS